MKNTFALLLISLGISASSNAEIFNDYPNQPSDEELDEKYTVLETFVFPEGRGFLVQVNGAYEFPRAMPSLMSAQSKHHQDQTDVAIAKVEELIATLDIELGDRALVMVGNFTADKLPDVMIQLNVPVESGEVGEDGRPLMETVWFANVPTSELPPQLPRNLSDSVADPTYRIVNDYQTYPDLQTKN